MAGSAGQKRRTFESATLLESAITLQMVTLTGEAAGKRIDEKGYAYF